MGDRQPSTTGVDDPNKPVPAHGQSGRHGTPERTPGSHHQSCAAVAAPDVTPVKPSSVAKPPALKLATVTDQFDGPTSLRHALQHICHAQAATRTPSTRTSSSSLQALSEDAVVDARSDHDLLRQALVAHTTQPEHATADVPVYPDQSYAVLQSQVHHTFYPPFTRSRSAYPDVTARPPPAKDSRTAGNTPASSPGLFSAHSPRSTPPLVSDDEERVGSPFLHPTHLQPPKETHTAAVDRDSITGNKLVNQYELLEELGRGEHGKVKLGRHIVTKQQVAIKIVQRYSKRRRLGKLGNPEDKVKKEIAILKKARHPNVVSLLEVIDDPNRQKVYIVLEYVENGEIVWRKKGLKEIIQADKRRLEREKAGEPDTPAFLEECELYVRTAQRMRRQREKARERRQAMAAEAQRHPIPAWSLEHGGESDDELGPALSIARTTSRSMLNQDEYHPSPSHSFVSTSELDRRGAGVVGGPADAAALAAAFEGSMYGAYVDFPPYERRFSTASSSLGFVPSEPEWTSEDDDMSYVPCLTITEARNAFRDSVLGLEYLHYQGIIHRDIKPANLLVTANHRVKISDFGVSYLGRPIRDDEDEQVGETDATELDDARELSKTVGTPAFYAPELCYTGDDFVKQIGSVPKITGAIDVWSLGVTLYGMIFGRLPFVSDDDYSMFQTIVKQDVFIPRKRLRPVEDDPDTRAATQWPRSINTGKRADETLAYEEIDDELFDLLKRLLTKDPSKRITLKEIKHHPWLLHGLPNPSLWIEETDPGHQSKGKKIEVSNEEVTTAVSKVPPFIQRVRSNVAKWSGYLTGRTRDKDGRKRATSSVTSVDSCHSSASSKDNVVPHHSWDGRRASLRGDEDVVRTTTPKGSSRDGEHPLATSVTASPVERDEESPKSIRAEANRQPSPVRGRLARPAPPQRAASARSTAESTKTVRPSDFEAKPSGQHPRASTPTFSESSTGAFHVGGLFSGASRRLAKGFHIGDYRAERSPSIDSAFLDADRHPEPGAALGAAPSAIGRMPGAGLWREGYTLSPAMAAPVTAHRRNRSHQLSCQSSTESFPDHSSHGPRADGGSLTVRADGCGAEPGFSHDSIDPRQKLPPLPEPGCPPASAITTDSGDGGLRTSPPSAATISSSSADDYTSGMSQCASHPSIPSVVSGASSLSGDGFRVHTKDGDVDLSSVPVVPSPLPRTDDTATVRQVVLEDDESRYDCDDEDDSDDEGIIIMGKKKPQQTANRSRD